MLHCIFNLEDPSENMSRLRLGLQKFEFDVKYKKRKANIIAEYVLRLPVFRYSTVDVESVVPVFVLSDDLNIVSSKTDLVETST